VGLFARRRTLPFCLVLFSLDRKNGAHFLAVDLDGLGVDQDEFVLVVQL
jgi:hypothetical protein